MSVAVVDDFIYDFVDKDEVFPNALFVKHSAVISEDLHHPVEDVHHIGRAHVVLRSSHEVNPELLRKKVVYPIHILVEKSESENLGDLQKQEEGLLARI